ncbi:alpha/beta hydrolase [Cellulophaga sp. F20128]|uniref:alpha/beta hydrolase n=1 Tax=Cellulophaga sp. F20128 TaxID=2926413 RepID=UPI001FF14FAA|nr:alpha/beta hydrolase [Cellulophaga sp. F20128]MCK0157669.1 alpha/beta hydrolase [Cellulophaga sp. F20128]
MIHVYFMPGMAANPTIFKNIRLPEAIFQQHLLEWFVPSKGMTLEDYAKKMCTKIEHSNVVLIGVSFGGFLVQEMAKHIKTRKVIIISSVKTNKELPKRMLLAKYTKAHKLLPTGLVTNMEVLHKYAFGDAVTKRLELYDEFLSVKDKYYLDWSLDQIVNWNQTSCDPNVVHIHGDKDPVFPIRHIKDCITVSNGTHIMIINRFKWFNEHLPKIILD